jgi:ABC-type dipeptide/oligopeptide/nickel transport system ATPase component
MGFSRPRVNCIVETATAAELFEAPRHPSTRMLLDALQSGRDRALIRSRPQTGDAANDHVEHNGADGEAKLGRSLEPERADHVNRHCGGSSPRPAFFA